MSTWTNISDTVLEPGKPIRSVDALALRDNPVAIAGGAANAPRVQTAAIQNGAVTPAKMQPPNAGNNNILSLIGGTESNASRILSYGPLNRELDPEKTMSFVVLIPGVVRVTFQHRNLEGGASQARIVRNTTTLATYNPPVSQTYATRTLDITCTTGDTIYIQFYRASGAVSHQWRNMFVRSGNIVGAVA
jgi:hypothetical protein